MRYLLTLIIALSFFAACNKDNSTPQTTTTIERNIRFINRTDTPLIIKVYKSLSGYINDTGQFVDTILPPQSIYRLSLTDLGNYYADCYSTDYSLTNWGTFRIDNNGFSSPAFTLLGASRSDSVVIRPQNWVVMQPRILAINGNLPHTVWHAINCINKVSGKSIWSTLDTDSRYKKLTLSKDLSATFSIMRQGTEQVKPGAYSVSYSYNTRKLTVSFMSGFEGSVPFTYAVPQSFSPDRATDTLVYQAQDSLYYLVKE